MSDAITLDVLSSSPVQLDAGDADPIAREEIAALATRVTTVEGDVTALGTTVDGIDARVEAIEADYVTSEDVMGALGGEAPTLVSGSSRAMLGDPETASWMARQTHADGAAVVESVKGNTLRWNQLNDNNRLPQTVSGVTITTGANGAAIVTGQSTLDNSVPIANAALAAGHKYLIKGCPAGGGASTCDVNVSGFGLDYGAGSMFTSPSDYTNTYLRLHVRLNAVFDNVTFYPQLFDLTAMFGAGNEPSTVAEFEALFPEPYYPYDPGSLLPVRMEGVETVAADESWSSQRTIPAATYFPDGMRSAGSVRDELMTDEAITRVGERAYQSGDESDASVITDGTVTHYALTTPTTTPIDPPLPMSYRVGAGGTERVMVASGTTSAPPIFVTRYPLDPADLAASIAPRESATAEANHAVGDLIMLGWTLCKVTTAIARGEAITIGTNVTQTSVAAEIAALS